MAWRGPNPAVLIRCGAAVFLLAAGTLTAIVIAEWPRTGQLIAVQAAPRRESPRLTARAGGVVGAAGAHIAPTSALSASHEPPTSVNLGALLPLDSNPFIAHIPPLVLAGSAEETRREVEASVNTAPPTRIRPRSCGNSLSTYVDLDDYVEWWRTTPNGREFAEIISYDSARQAASGQHSGQSHAAEGHSSMTTRESAGATAGVDGTPLQSDLYDFTVRLDGTSVLPPTTAAELGAATGVRAANLFDPAAIRAIPAAPPLPVTDGDASLKWGAGSALRARAVGEAPGVIRDYVDLRLEQVWNLGPATSFSVGWSHLRGLVSNELPEPTVRQDAILLELKLGF
jgi:hypothetical protein